MLCIICKNQDIKILYSKNKYRFYLCSCCNFIFLNPIPSKKIIDLYYEEFSYDTGFKNEKLIRNDAKKSLQILSKLINKGTVLDVGCGAGFFLDEARKNNWTIEGIDMSTTAIQYARDKLNIPVLLGDFLELNFLRKKYNVIVMNQVIEHLRDPLPILNKAISLLKPKGILLIATPNNNSVMSFIQKEKFNYVIPPEHILYFSPFNLKILMNRLGLNTLIVRTWSYPSDFAGIGKFLVKGKEGMHNQTSNYAIENTMNQVSRMKKIKSMIYDGMISNTFYKLLNIHNHGSMFEIYAQKI